MYTHISKHEKKLFYLGTHFGLIYKSGIFVILTDP